MLDEKAVRTVAGTGVPIRGDDIDTDQILPARFLKEVTFDGMADYLFYDARRNDDGSRNDHPLNRFETASIAVVNANFGCGSSREHAPQAMQRWGIDGVVGESFAEIFRDNCASLGMPAVTAEHDVVTVLQDWIEANPGGTIEVDVDGGTVRYGDTQIDVDVDEAMRESLLQGTWDTTAVMRSNRAAVAETAADLPYVGVTDPSGPDAPSSGDTDPKSTSGRNG